MESPQNLYSQSPWQIFIKNFLAGFAKGIGSLTLYVISIFAVYKLLVQPKLGDINEFFNLYKDSMQTLKTIQSTGTAAPQINLNDLLNQLQIPTN